MNFPVVSCALAIGLMIAISAAAFSSAPCISVMIANEADAPPDMMARARDVLSNIFLKAGIRTRWQQCDRPKCPPPRNPTVIGVIIRSDAPAHARRSALGISLPGVGQGNRVGVFYSRIEAISRDTVISIGVPVPDLLAHVIAHEIGHLLLDWRTHSQAGMMRTEWTSVEFGAMRQRKLFFSSSEAKAMRRAVQKRTSAPSDCSADEGHLPRDKPVFAAIASQQ